jgi:hypothetical protein
LLAKRKTKANHRKGLPFFRAKTALWCAFGFRKGSIAERRGKTILGPISGISAALAISLAFGSVSLVALALLSLKNAPPLR